MYGIPNDVDWSFVIGAQVEQICIGTGDVQVRLFQDIVISIQGDFDHLAQSKCLSNSPHLWVRATTLVSLLGTRIEDAVSKGGNTLVLSYSNGEELRIYDSNENYESFTVTFSAKTIVV